MQSSISNAYSVTVDVPSSAEAIHSEPVARHGGFIEHRAFRILLIDDNRDAIDSMGALLELMDYDIRTAEDAESGLAIAASFQPHLVLSDIGLPGMDGYALAPHLREAAGERKLILAAVTSYGRARDKARAREAGFDYHLVKPVDADALLEFVARQFREY
ncbi:response regulator [Noviherbaspirillum pedocola]|uniref:Response regulator n=1 Tax=Noviherbaspirillum pedocola TaxID=2801341 RepID=A0A934SXK9_9BURK|nr:response regulator [Noviherbaspirillum pedocola]MBK4737524.1 response regulator [Noviherbaspirillum pedocola]